MNKKAKIVYIAHPIGGDIERNLLDLKRIIKVINETYPDVVPFVPYYGDVASCNGNEDQRSRKKGIFNDHTIIKTGICDECWLTGDGVSEGMEGEQNLFDQLGTLVLNRIGEF